MSTTEALQLPDKDPLWPKIKTPDYQLTECDRDVAFRKEADRIFEMVRRPGGIERIKATHILPGSFAQMVGTSQQLFRVASDIALMAVSHIARTRPGPLNPEKVCYLLAQPRGTSTMPYTTSFWLEDFRSDSAIRAELEKMSTDERHKAYNELGLKWKDEAIARGLPSAVWTSGAEPRTTPICPGRFTPQPVSNKPTTNPSGPSLILPPILTVEPTTSPSGPSTILPPILTAEPRTGPRAPSPMLRQPLTAEPRTSPSVTSALAPQVIAGQGHESGTSRGKNTARQSSDVVMTDEPSPAQPPQEEELPDAQSEAAKARSRTSTSNLLDDPFAPDADSETDEDYVPDDSGASSNSDQNMEDARENAGGNRQESEDSDETMTQ